MHKFHSEEKSSADILFGIRPVMEALQAGKEVDRILIRNGADGPLFAALKKILRERKIIHQYVPPEKLNRITAKNHQGVVAFVTPVTYQSLEDILPAVFEQGKTPLLLFLDRITDVRNFGAIARTAESAGVHAIIIPSRGAAQINADAVKTSAGALFNIPVCREHNLKDTLDYLKNSGVKLVACTEKGDVNYFDVDFSSPVALLLGSEENGVSPEYLRKADIKTKIPMLGKTASLNVSVAAGVILFEAVKQRISQRQ